MSAYHNPVMLSECMTYLNLRPGKVYVDATLGGGGHSQQIFQCKSVKHVYAFDQDAEAIAEARSKLTDFAEQLTIIKANFSQLRTELALHRVKSIDGILFDLGVSSHQLDTAGRGFSLDKDADLDMRMDTATGQTAADLVNDLPLAELTRILREYGEEQAAYKIAQWIVSARAHHRITTTGDLNHIIENGMRSNPAFVLKTKVRVYQALRIALNQELEVMQTALTDAVHLLAPGGRIVIMSYHSLDDRIAKGVLNDFARGCICPPNVLKCVCQQIPRIKVLTNKPITASEQELRVNSRARSAKLRAAEKIDPTEKQTRYPAKMPNRMRPNQ
jgi:16S rRNA (cytosine1402-N4)-methyltransferase